MAQSGIAHSEQDELEYLSSATLTKRKDFIDREEEARNAPNRVLYYRRNADNDRLIQVCTDKLQVNPRNVRALLIRAASYVKKGTTVHQVMTTRPYLLSAAAKQCYLLVACLAMLMIMQASSTCR